jgi:hypothetical protein
LGGDINTNESGPEWSESIEESRQFIVSLDWQNSFPDPMIIKVEPS